MKNFPINISQWSTEDNQTTAYEVDYNGTDTEFLLNTIQQSGWKYLTKNGKTPLFINTQKDLIEKIKFAELEDSIFENINFIVDNLNYDFIPELEKIGFSFALKTTKIFEIDKKEHFVIIDPKNFENIESQWFKNLSYSPKKILLENIDSMEDLSSLSWMIKSGWKGDIQENLPPLKDLSPQQKEIMDLMNACSRAPHLQMVEQLVKSSVFITGQMFKFVGSAASPYAHMRIQNVRQAVHTMGLGNLYKWLSGLWVSYSSGYPFLQERALVRARYCELKGKMLGRNMSEQDALFLVGLFSVLETLSGKSIDDLSKSFCIPDLSLSALKEDSSSELLPILTSELDPDKDFLLKIESIAWSRKVQSSI